MIRSLVLRKAGDIVSAGVEDLSPADAPDVGEVTVHIHYSSLNYKDALAVTGRGKVIRGAYPFVPGIDLVGTVIESDSEEFEQGDTVIGTGWGIGEEHWGGYRDVARLRSEWLVKLPDGMKPRDAMGIGTAGFTAMLAVLALIENGVSKDLGDVVVTGATGGVGSFSVMLLAARGFGVVASTGKNDAGAYLERLGATRILARDELGRGARRPLDSALWAGAIDSVGGTTLEALLSQMGRHGCVAACGLAGGAELHTTVYPFILRGIRLIGIDSNTCPHELRQRAWQCLADELDTARIGEMTRTIELQDVPSMSEQLLGGQIRGRCVVRVGGDSGW